MATKIMSNHSVVSKIPILLYCAIIGSAFLAISIIYLATLHGVQREKILEGICGDDSDRPLTTPIDDLILVISSASRSRSSPSDSTPVCHDLKKWKLTAIIGIVYGILCLIYGVIKLWPILWGDYFVPSLYSSPKRRESLESGKKGKKIFTKIADSHHDLLVEQGRRPRQTNFGYWSACFNCLQFMTTSIVMGIIWLASLVVPSYVAVRLVAGDAIHGNDGQFYWLALGLFGICLLSLIFVTMAAMAMLCLRVRFWIIAVDTQSAPLSSGGGGGGDPVEKSHEEYVKKDIEAADKEEEEDGDDWKKEIIFEKVHLKKPPSTAA